MPATATVLEIAKNVAAAIGFQPPDTLRSNQDPNSRLLLSLLNRGCRRMASKRGPFGESWVELTREHVTETVAGQADYALPEGFAGLITDSVWDRSTYREAPGPLTPQQWQRLKGGLIDTVALTPRYRVALNEDLGTVRLRLDPTPSGEEQIAFEYLSLLWARESAGSPISLDEVAEDGHIPVFPSDLVELDLEWRVRKSQGLNYLPDIAEFEVERDRLFAQSGGLKDVYMAPHSEDTLGLGAVSIPESGFGGV